MAIWQRRRFMFRSWFRSHEDCLKLILCYIIYNERREEGKCMSFA